MNQSIFIEPNGPSYRVYFEDCLIIAESRTPGLEACRYLLERGYQGRLEMRRKGKPCADMIFDIEKAARLMVRDDPKGRPCFQAYPEDSQKTGCLTYAGGDSRGFWRVPATSLPGKANARP